MQFQLLRERKAVINCDATYVRERIIISWRRERLRNHSDGDWQYPPGTCDIAREKSGVSPRSFPDDKCLLNETHNGTRSRRQERGNTFCRLTSYEAVSWLSQIECLLQVAGVDEITVSQPCHVSTNFLPTYLLHTITGNPFFLSARQTTVVLRNETDEDLSPARRAFAWARIIRVSLCNQIRPRIMRREIAVAVNESDNPDNLCNNVESVSSGGALGRSRKIARWENNAVKLSCIGNKI